MTEQEPRILLVDDDPAMIRVLARALKELGKVHFTTLGAEAVALAQSVMPDLILLDIEIPDLHGFEICKALKSDPDLAETSVLFITSHTGQELEAQALQFGAIDFIHKPPHLDIVKARVSNYLALKQRTDALQRLTMLDGLTGIANRRAFDKAISNEWRRACRNRQSLALMMIDVDHFKTYNDKHGHLAGDDCLRDLAVCFASKLRRPGDLAARYGGEEFALLLPQCHLIHAVEVAESICHEVPGRMSKDLPPVTVSIGVAASTWPAETGGQFGRHKPDVDPDSAQTDIGLLNLIERADAALYRAKQAGRNRVRTDQD